MINTIFWVTLILLLITLIILFPWILVIFLILFLILALPIIIEMLKEDPEYKYRDELNKKIIAKYTSNK